MISKEINGYTVVCEFAADGVTPIVSTQRPNAVTYAIDAAMFIQEYSECFGDMSDTDDHTIYMRGLVLSINSRIKLYNTTVDKANRWAFYGRKELEAFAVAECMLIRHNICFVQTSGRINGNPLGIFVDETIARGPDDPELGTYSLEEDTFTRVMKMYCPDMTERKRRDILLNIRAKAPLRPVLKDPRYAILKNGLYDREQKKLVPFSPEFVITTKCAVDYNPNAKLPKIQQADGTIWSPDQLLPSFTSDPEIARLLMEGLAAILRPYTRWDRMFWLYSTVGCNGKGTYCALARNIVGEHACASINIPDMAKDFCLESLPHSIAVIADENPVGTFIDTSDRLKAIVTGDELLINMKYRPMFSYSFPGFVMQCINEFPRVKDQSHSFLRRVLIVEFDQNFLGRENKYIKSDYIKRQDVLEWFVLKALELDIDEFHIPASCERLVREFSMYNNPVEEFLDEVLPQYSWDLIPFAMMYEQYKYWMETTQPNSKALGRTTFIEQVLQCIRLNDDWICPDKRAKYSCAGRMNGPELTIAKYGCSEAWINPAAKRSNIASMCSPKMTGQKRGILRVHPNSQNADALANKDELVDKSQVPSNPATVWKLLGESGAVCDNEEISIELESKND